MPRPIDRWKWSARWAFGVFLVIAVVLVMDLYWVLRDVKASVSRLGLNSHFNPCSLTATVLSTETVDVTGDKVARISARGSDNSAIELTGPVPQPEAGATITVWRWTEPDGTYRYSWARDILPPR